MQQEVEIAVVDLAEEVDKPVLDMQDEEVEQLQESLPASEHLRELHDEPEALERSSGLLMQPTVLH